MTVEFLKAFSEPELAQQLIQQIKAKSRTPIRLMEVCGTHTVALFRSGIRSVLPETISLLSGPGCPVCVTAQQEIDAFIALARQEDVIITTFGDLIRVPGTCSSLQQQRAGGRDIRMVYATTDALAIARENPARQVVFLGVGFETTAPTVAAAVMAARAEGLKNFSVISAHKLVPPALAALIQTANIRLDGFILPGHASVIIGLNAYRPVFAEHPMAAVVTGFEPIDILQGLALLVAQIEAGEKQLANAYPRAVTAEGNQPAQKILADVFRPVDALWRGLSVIPRSGLALAEAYGEFDATRRFQIEVEDVPEPKGCACGEILTGLKTPPECALYQKKCTPAAPVGPCMVSSEGTCAAYYRYQG